MNFQEYHDLIATKKKRKPYRQIEGQHQTNLGMLLNGVLRGRMSPKLIFWSYSASGEKKPLKTAILQKRKGLQKGKLDYEFFLNEENNMRAVFLETKTTTGSLTPEQKQFFKSFEEIQNVSCYTSKSIEESIQILEKEKILLT